MSVVDNLNLINQYKGDIKQAIIDKGVDMTGTPLSGYAGKIGEIPTGSDPVTEELNVTDNGTYTPGEGVDGYSKVVVNVSSGGGSEYIEPVVVNWNDIGPEGYTNDTARRVILVKNTTSDITASTLHLANCEVLEGINNNSIAGDITFNDAYLPKLKRVGRHGLTGIYIKSYRDYDRGFPMSELEVLEPSSIFLSSNMKMDAPKLKRVEGYAGMSSRGGVGYSSIRFNDYSSIKYIGDYAFYSSYISIANPTVFNNLEYLGFYAFYNNVNISEYLTFPKLTFMGNSALWGCERIKGLSFPLLKEVNRSALRDLHACTEMRFGAVEKFYTNSCITDSTSVLRNIYITAPAVPVLEDANVFSGHNGIEHIYVPADLVDSYKADTNWSTYASKITALP